MTFARPEWAAIGLILYVAALAIVLRWMASRAPILDRDDERGFDDEQIAAMREIEREKP